MKHLASPSKYDKYVFLDRDGVINVERGDYTITAGEWQWTDDALEGIRKLTENGYGVIVITNQACIHKGLQTHEGLEILHRHMIDTIRANGGDIVAVYYCPHWTPDNCGCRKPEPGLFFEAAEDYGINLAGTFFIGDAARDMEAGKRAGVRTIFLEGSKAGGSMIKTEAGFIAGSLNEAVETVIRGKQ